MRKLFSILLTFIFISLGNAQNRNRLDSLYAIERTTTNDTLKVNLLNQICQEYLITDPEVAHDYASQALEAAEGIKYPKGQAYAYRNLAMYYYNKNEFNEAITYHVDALNLFENLDDKKGMLLSYNSIGLIYYRQGYYPLATKYYINALGVLEDIGDKEAIATTYTNIGNIYYRGNNLVLATDYYQQAMRVQTEMGDSDGVGESLNNIGNINYQKKNFRQALEYFQRAVNILERSKDKSLLASCYNNMGNTFIALGNIDLGILYYQKALTIEEELNDILAEANTFNNLARAYEKNSHYDLAIKSRTGAITKAKQVDATEILRDAYEGLAGVYEKQGNYIKSLEYYKLYTSTRSIVYNKENARSLAELSTQHNLEKKEKAIEILTKEKKVSEVEKKQQRLILNSVIGGLALLLVLAVVVYTGYRQKKTALRTLAEKNEIIIRQKEEGEREKKRAEDLLLNILPSETAEELKNHGRAAPRYYKMVTVLFTDFKGFTLVADKLSPEQLVYELDTCFRKFDEITSKYGIEKIKTIGDAYLCAGGLPIRNKTNPMDVMLAALEIQKFMDEWKAQKIKEGKEYWEVRIGVNTGPVVAGIVGSKKFAYDIWGDTVNVAARMEQNSEAGRVNISGETYTYVNTFFNCNYRGKVPAKNKGEIAMYFVDGIKKELSVNGEGLIPNDAFFEQISFNLTNKVNYKEAGQYIVKLLSDKLDERLTYHNIHHTLGVSSAVERIAKSEGIDGDMADILKTAALFHDAGFVRQYDNNEEIGVEIAKEVLPQYGFTKKQITTIERLILATKVPQQPNDLLEQIMCDADLDYLGRNDFHDIADTLRQELTAYGKITGRRQWDEIQVKFLEKHQYFTESNKKRREAKKQQYLMEVKQRLEKNEYTD